RPIPPRSGRSRRRTRPSGSEARREGSQAPRGPSLTGLRLLSVGAVAPNAGQTRGATGGQCPPPSVASMAGIRTLLLDNYDSFTFNLFQLLAEVNGCDPVVVRNDGASWAELARGGFDNIVISPGPGRPQHAADLGVCADAIREAGLPLLGVCLGHQGLGYFCGGDVVGAPEVMHGRLSAVYHDGSALFAGIPQGFQAVRYHSLCVAEPLPACL